MYHIVINVSEDSNKALQKALDILLLFQAGNDPLSIEDISSKLDIPKSTVYRHVRVLTDKGFLERSDPAHYQLGLTFIVLSRLAHESTRDIRLAALPAMQEIAHTTGESVSLMRVFGHQVICIENIEGTHALRVRIDPGRTQPLHAGASSKILLAYIFKDDDWHNIFQFPLVRYTPQTITEAGVLLDEVAAIRERGYAVSEGEVDEGGRAVAVPLRNRRGDVIAALSIEAPAIRMSDAILRDYIALLHQHADVIQHNQI